MPAGQAPAPMQAPGAASTIDYPVFFEPHLVQAKVLGAKRVRSARIVSLVISLGITFAIFWFFRDQLGALTWPVVAISAALPLGYLTWAIIREVVARREASAITDGLAVGVTRTGLLLRDGLLPWSEVATLQARSRRLGRSDDLVVTARDGRSTGLPLDYLSVKPATLDGAVRALSGGRCRVDFAKLDV